MKKTPEVFPVKDLAPVLIVEDDLEISSFISEYFTERGIETQQIHSGLEAMELLKKVQPDLLILDYKLPVFNGLEIYRLLREKSGHTELPILMISGFQEKMILEAIQVDPSACFLKKPFTLDEIWKAACRLNPEFKQTNTWDVGRLRNILTHCPVAMVPIKDRPQLRDLMVDGLMIPYVLRSEGSVYYLFLQKYSDVTSLAELSNRALEMEVILYEYDGQNWIKHWPLA